MPENEIDHTHTDIPVCPHCGHRHKDWWDYGGSRRDEESWDMICESCDGKFRVVKHVVVSFSTKKD
jgi:hypothetical protein